jgi:hypothetical protein
MSKDIADLVIEDIKTRKIMGEKKYGVPLRANNGRNALQDLYEELQDATQYCRQMLEEGEDLLAYIKECKERGYEPRTILEQIEARLTIKNLCTGITE